MYALGLSFNFVSLTSILYAYFIVPRTAWTPIGRGVWSGWSVLGRLGIAGIGQTASAWWTWELVGLAASLFGRVSLAAQSVLLVSSSLISTRHQSHCVQPHPFGKLRASPSSIFGLVPGSMIQLMPFRYRDKQNLDW